MLGMITSLFGLLSTGVKGFFGLKKEQSDVVQSALGVMKDVNASNSQREQAIAQIITAEAGSGYWLAAVWRPLVMVVFLGLIMAHFFGYAPEGINDKLSPMMGKIFDLLEIGLMGYIPARTIEKVIKDINVGRILKSFIDKQLG